MDSLYRQALADYREKRYARAIPQLERTIRLEPGHRWAHNVLGYCRLEMGQFDGAAAAFRRSLTRAPNRKSTLFGLGRAALGLKQYTRAITLFRKVHAMAPRYATMWTHYNIGLALQRLTRNGEAAAAYDTALTTPTAEHVPQLYLAAARLARIRQQLAHALSYARRGVSVFPREAWLWNELGWLEELHDRPVEGRKAYDRAGRLLARSKTPAHKTRLRLPFAGRWRVVQGNAGAYSHRSLGSYFSWDVRACDAQGRVTRTEKPARNEDFHGWGRPILAPADALVIEVRDGIHDNRPGQTNKAAPRGNYVELRFRAGERMQLFHLQKGSIAVQVGQRVSRGQLLGLCGNSGYSTGPHLCFSLHDAKHLSRPSHYDYALHHRGTVTEITRGVPTVGQIVVAR